MLCSSILQSVLPFCPETDIGHSVLIRGIGLYIMHVPLHKLVHSTDLVQDEVIIGVHSSLPDEGLVVILGSELAGRDVSPPLVSILSAHLREVPDESAQSFPKVFTACAVTRAMSRSESVSKSGVFYLFYFILFHLYLI